MKERFLFYVLFVLLLSIMVVGVYKHFDQPVYLTCSEHAENVSAQTLDCE